MRNKSLFILTMLGLSFFSRAQTSSLFDTITPIRQATMRSVLDTSNAYGISSMDSIELIRTQYATYLDTSIIGHVEITLYRQPDSLMVDSIYIPLADSLFYTDFGSRVQFSGQQLVVKSPNLKKVNSLFGQIRLLFLDQTISNAIPF